MMIVLEEVERMEVVIGKFVKAVASQLSDCRLVGVGSTAAQQDLYTYHHAQGASKPVTPPANDSICLRLSQGLGACLARFLVWEAKCI